MFRTVLRALVTIGLMAAATTLTGCGGVDKTQPCKNIQQEMQKLSQASAQQRDPKAVAATLRASATKIRNEGAPVGGAVKKASSDAATALENLANNLAQGTPEKADLAALPKTGADIKSACA